MSKVEKIQDLGMLGLVNDVFKKIENEEKDVKFPTHEKVAKQEKKIGVCNDWEKATLLVIRHLAEKLRFSRVTGSLSFHVYRYLEDQVTALKGLLWSSIECRLAKFLSQEEFEKLQENGLGIRNEWQIVILDYYPLKGETKKTKKKEDLSFIADLLKVSKQTISEEIMNGI